MKKIYSLFVLILITFSCSESDSLIPSIDSNNAASRQDINGLTVLDPTKLAKVIFYPGTTYQKNWFFYPNGLLRKITDSNGTLLQKFVYYSNQNLLSSTKYSGSFPVTTTYTYDNSVHINSINGNAINYDAATNQYINGTSIVALNDQSLIVHEQYSYEDFYDFDEFGNPIYQTYLVSGISVGYTNNNLTASYLDDSPSSNHYQHDTNSNPFKTALYPICKSLGVFNFGNFSEKWVFSEYNSINNVTEINYDIDDPESQKYVYTFNANNLPITRTRKDYYFGTLESTTLDVKYYYQGDVIPN